MDWSLVGPELSCKAAQLLSSLMAQAQESALKSVTNRGYFSLPTLNGGLTLDESTDMERYPDQSPRKVA